MLSVIHVAQIILLALKKDDSEAIERQSTAYLIVKDACAQIEPLVVLAGLGKLTLLL